MEEEKKDKVEDSKSSSPKKSNTMTIGIVAGCCILLLIVLVVGGYFLSKSITAGVDKINEAIESEGDKFASDLSSSFESTDGDFTYDFNDGDYTSVSGNDYDESYDLDSVVSYNNVTVEYRDNIVEAIDALTSAINDDISAESIAEAVVGVGDGIDNLKISVVVPCQSEELNDLLAAYIVSADRVHDAASMLVLDYDDTEKFNADIEIYNDMVDDLEIKGSDINDFVDRLNARL